MEDLSHKKIGEKSQGFRLFPASEVESDHVPASTEEDTITATPTTTASSSEPARVYYRTHETSFKGGWHGWFAPSPSPSQKSETVEFDSAEVSKGRHINGKMEGSAARRDEVVVSRDERTERRLVDNASRGQCIAGKGE